MDDWDLDSPPRTAPTRAPAPQEGEPPPAPASPEIANGTARTEAKPAATVIASTAAAPRRPRRRRGSLLAWIAGGLILMIVGALIGFYIARAQGDDERATLTETQQQLAAVKRDLAQSEDRNSAYYRTNQLLQTEIDQLRNGYGGQATTTSTTPPAGSGKTYADGIYLVGRDIAPGTYDGVVKAALGYWARLKDTDGLVSSIISNGLPQGPFVLTVIESDKAVELRGVELQAR